MNSIQEQEKIVEKEIKKLEAMGGKLTGSARRVRDSLALRFPVVFILFSAFGLVATFYGFEKLIDEIPSLANNSKLLLAVGLIILTITGTLFKKLDN